MKNVESWHGDAKRKAQVLGTNEAVQEDLESGCFKRETSLDCWYLKDGQYCETQFIEILSLLDAIQIFDVGVVLELVEFRAGATATFHVHVCARCHIEGM